MKKINATKPILSLDGDSIKINGADFHIGNAIANILTGKPNKFGPLKSWILAKRFYSESEIEIDEADFGTLVGIIETNDHYGAIVLGQILEEIKK